MPKQAYITDPKRIDLVEFLQDSTGEGLQFVREYKPTGEGGIGFVYHYMEEIKILLKHPLKD